MCFHCGWLIWIFLRLPKWLSLLNERISHPFFGYAGDDEPLIETICEWVFKRHGWKIQPDWIMLMPGVVTGMNWVAQTFLKPDDSLCFHTPVYPPFFRISEYAGANKIEIPMIVQGKPISD